MHPCRRTYTGSHLLPWDIRFAWRTNRQLSRKMGWPVLGATHRAERSARDQHGEPREPDDPLREQSANRGHRNSARRRPMLHLPWDRSDARSRRIAGHRPSTGGATVAAEPSRSSPRSSKGARAISPRSLVVVASSQVACFGHLGVRIAFGPGVGEREMDPNREEYGADRDSSGPRHPNEGGPGKNRQDDKDHGPDESPASQPSPTHVGVRRSTQRPGAGTRQPLPFERPRPRVDLSATRAPWPANAGAGR